MKPVLEKLMNDRLVGDATIRHCSINSRQFRYGQSLSKCGDQRPLVDEFISLSKTNGLHVSVYDTKGTKNQGPRHLAYATITGSNLYDNWYVGGEWVQQNNGKGGHYWRVIGALKRIPKNFELWADTQTMARWIEDDGSLCKTHGILILCTEGFIKADVLKLKHWIDEFFGLSSRLAKTNTGYGFRIIISKEDYEDKIAPEVASYIHPCATRKLPEGINDWSDISL